MPLVTEFNRLLNSKQRTGTRDPGTCSGATRAVRAVPRGNSRSAGSAPGQLAQCGRRPGAALNEFVYFKNIGTAPGSARNPLFIHLHLMTLHKFITLYPKSIWTYLKINIELFLDARFIS